MTEEYLAAIERGRKTLTPERMARIAFQMSLPHRVLADPERAERLWQRFLQLQQEVGTTAAALAIHLMPEEEQEQG
jgi:hypothetical protein